MSEVSPSFEVQVVGAAVVDSLVAPTRMLAVSYTHLTLPTNREV